MDTTMESRPNCVRYDCAANTDNKCQESFQEYPCQIAGLLLAKNPVAKKMPQTRADFRLAALWLFGRQVGKTTASLLGGPDKDDEAAGVCLGYRDNRDRI